MPLSKEIEDNVKIKVCTKCKRKLTLDMFHKRNSNSDGLRSMCKDCNNERSKKHYIKVVKKKKYNEKNQEIKVCSRCKKELTLDMFDKDRSRKSGLKSHCKDCKSEWSKKYYEENIDKITIVHNKYYEENKDILMGKCKIYRNNNKDKSVTFHKKYYEENKDTIAIQKNKYYEENKDILTKKNKKYKNDNKDKVNIWSQKRRARKCLLPSTLTVEQWTQCKNYFSNRCCYCNEEKPLAQEHFVPVASKGSYSICNIVPACKSCNSSKGTKPFHSWYSKYKSYSKEREDKILEYLKANNTDISAEAI